MDLIWMPKNFCDTSVLKALGKNKAFLRTYVYYGHVVIS